MIHDDRLDTVLRTPAAGAGASRIRYAQLVDLLGRVSGDGWTSAHDAALLRLDELASAFPAELQASVLAAAPLRSVPLVRHLAGAAAAPAAAAMANARLGEADWLAIIPELPVRARGFLRRRGDLGARVERLLKDLGANDLALPLPDGYASGQAAARPEAGPPAGEEEQIDYRLRVAMPVRPPAPAPAKADVGGIGAIVRRIEAFRRARSEASEAPAGDPRLPFAEEAGAASGRITEIAFRTDAEGAIDWADGPVQPLLWGHHPFTAEADAPARCDLGTLRTAKARAPIREGRLEIDGPDPVAGPWQIDAIPLFADRGGRFTGYIGRLRRPVAESPSAPDASDQLRQLLHELRTPVNAIQGFAELIQQQIFGPTPHEYRSLAAAIAADAAHILGGFEDIDRLIKLETGHLALDPGAADLGETVARMIRQLEVVVAPREVRLKLERPDGAFPVALEDIELERMLWRVLAVIGSAAQPGERLRFALANENGAFALSLPLPAALAAFDDEVLFAPDSRSSGAAGSAMLGSGFALRLAVAEARGAGGDLIRQGPRLRLSLPCLPEQFGNHRSGMDMAAGGAATPN